MKERMKEIGIGIIAYTLIVLPIIADIAYWYFVVVHYFQMLVASHPVVQTIVIGIIAYTFLIIGIFITVFVFYFYVEFFYEISKQCE